MCEDTMLLRLIEPEKPGFDAQTFECPKCLVSETFVISISSEVDASNAFSLGSRTTPPCSRYYKPGSFRSSEVFFPRALKVNRASSLF
jgi:hypothetical protein